MRWRGRMVAWSWEGGWCSVAVAESRVLPHHRQVGPPLRCVGLLALSHCWAHFHACCRIGGASACRIDTPGLRTASMPGLHTASAPLAPMRRISAPCPRAPHQRPLPPCAASAPLAPVHRISAPCPHVLHQHLLVTLLYLTTLKLFTVRQNFALAIT